MTAPPSAAGAADEKRRLASDAELSPDNGTTINSGSEGLAWDEAPDKRLLRKIDYKVGTDLQRAGKERKLEFVES